jgi:hypothetical protein
MFGCVLYWYVMAGLRIKSALDSRLVQRPVTEYTTTSGSRTMLHAASYPYKEAGPYVQHVELTPCEGASSHKQSSKPTVLLQGGHVELLDMQTLHDNGSQVSLEVKMTEEEELQNLAAQLNYLTHPSSAAFQLDGLYWSTLQKLQRYLIANILIWIPSSCAVIFLQFGSHSVIAAYTCKFCVSYNDVYSAHHHGHYWHHCKLRVLGKCVDTAVVYAVYLNKTSSHNLWVKSILACLPVCMLRDVDAMVQAVCLGRCVHVLHVGTM